MVPDTHPRRGRGIHRNCLFLEHHPFPKPFTFGPALDKATFLTGCKFSLAQTLLALAQGEGHRIRRARCTENKVPGAEPACGIARRVIAAFSRLYAGDVITHISSFSPLISKA